MKDVAENENFASRWSRRKQQVQSEPEVDELVVEDETPKQSTEEERLEKLNELTDEDMPDVETLNEDSDFSGFMSTGVSETLRKMALQKLFHGKSYNIRDGLDEYDGDYTSFEKLDPSIITCDMKHLLEVEAEKLLAEEKEKEELLEAQSDEVEVAEAELSSENNITADEGVDAESKQDNEQGNNEIEDMEVAELEDVFVENDDIEGEGGMGEEI